MPALLKVLAVAVGLIQAGVGLIQGSVKLIHLFVRLIQAGVGLMQLYVGLIQLVAASLLVPHALASLDQPHYLQQLSISQRVTNKRNSRFRLKCTGLSDCFSLCNHHQDSTGVSRVKLDLSLPFVAV